MTIRVCKYEWTPTERDPHPGYRSPTRSLHVSRDRIRWFCFCSGYPSCRRSPERANQSMRQPRWTSTHMPISSIYSSFSNSSFSCFWPSFGSLYESSLSLLVRIVVHLAEFFWDSVGLLARISSLNFWKMPWEVPSIRIWVWTLLSIWAPEYSSIWISSILDISKTEWTISRIRSGGYRVSYFRRGGVERSRYGLSERRRKAWVVERQGLWVLSGKICNRTAESKSLRTQKNHLYSPVRSVRRGQRLPRIELTPYSRGWWWILEEANPGLMSATTSGGRYQPFFSQQFQQDHLYCLFRGYQ